MALPEVDSVEGPAAGGGPATTAWIAHHPVVGRKRHHVVEPSRAGDYVPKSMSHDVENTGDGPLKFLGLFRPNRFEDVSLNQGLALTPARLVKSHLGLDQGTIDHLSKAKKVIV